jgi:hypothetical protein
MMEAKMGQKEADDPTYNKGQGPTRENAARAETIRKMDDAQSRYAAGKDSSSTSVAKNVPPFPEKRGGRTKRKDGGKVFDGPSYPGKVPGAVGGRTAHAAGGKAGKGKTNVNIVIAAGKPAGAGDMMPPTGPVPPPGMGKPPGGVPVPVSPAGGAPAGGMPMGIPMPMPAPAPAAGAPPMARKSGGKVGHRNYRNYEDMDAGAGSAFGRLEKTDMARKKTGIQRA